MLAAALRLAAAGLRVFPVYGVRKGSDGGFRCTCKKGAAGRSGRCNSPGKHPACENGNKDGTTDETTVRALWGGRDWLNVGVATGGGIVVVDLDNEEAERWLASYEGLPATWEQSTARGRHLFFAGDGPTRADVLRVRGDPTGPHVDVRGQGGHVVVAPSNHASGRPYAWKEGHAPWECELAPLPEWLRSILYPPNSEGSVFQKHEAVENQAGGDGSTHPVDLDGATRPDKWRPAPEREKQFARYVAAKVRKRGSGDEDGKGGGFLYECAMLGYYSFAIARDKLIQLLDELVNAYCQKGRWEVYGPVESIERTVDNVIANPSPDWPFCQKVLAAPDEERISIVTEPSGYWRKEANGHSNGNGAVTLAVATPLVRKDPPKLSRTATTLAAIEASAFRISDLDFAARPPKRPAILYDLRTPVPSPLFLRGKCALLVADGGVGKGHLTLEMAVCLALGKDLFDTFRPEPGGGHIAMFVGEDDREEICDRMHRIGNAMRLTPDERTQLSRIHIYSVAALDLAIVEATVGGPAKRNDALVDGIIRILDTVARSEDFEWSLVVFDPLARFAGVGVETDNAVATTFVTALEHMAVAIVGRPAILCCHHTSKVGNRTGSPDARGVTGIPNAFRARFALREVTARLGAGEVAGVILTHDKANSTRKARPVTLARSDDERLGDGNMLLTAGVLRLATDAERDVLEAEGGVTGTKRTSPAQREAKNEAERTKRRQQRKAILLDCVPWATDAPDAGLDAATIESLAEEKGYIQQRGVRVSAELKAFAAQGLVVDLSNGRGQHRRWVRRSDD